MYTAEAELQTCIAGGPLVSILASRARRANNTDRSTWSSGAVLQKLHELLRVWVVSVINPRHKLCLLRG